MARNEEKSQSMLNRFLQAKREKKSKEQRPYLASECHNLVEAEKWRIQVLRDIGKCVSEIQNEGLGEHRIRDLNDNINKLIREKVHWERRIIELGGQNYLAQAPKIQSIDDQGQAVEGSTYKYFGAAKNLPGVKNLFYQPRTTPVVKRTRGEMYRGVDADYYGWRDDDDGLLVKLEAEQTKILLQKAMEEYKANKKQKIESMVEHNLMSYDASPPVSDTEDFENDVDQELDRPEESEIDDLNNLRSKQEAEKANENDANGREEIGFRQRAKRKREKLPDLLPPQLPSKEELEKALLKKKKEELIKRYISDDLQTDLSVGEQQVKVVLGKKIDKTA